MWKVRWSHCGFTIYGWTTMKWHNDKFLSKKLSILKGTLESFSTVDLHVCRLSLVCLPFIQLTYKHCETFFYQVRIRCWSLRIIVSVCMSVECCFFLNITCFTFYHHHRHYRDNHFHHQQKAVASFIWWHVKSKDELKGHTFLLSSLKLKLFFLFWERELLFTISLSLWFPIK